MRRFLFEGDDAQYITFLEDIVQKSGLLQPARLPPSSAGTTRNYIQHTPPSSEDEESVPSQQLRIIQYNPTETEKNKQTEKKRRAGPNIERWQKELDSLLSVVPSIDDLDLKAEEMGLGDNQIVVLSLVDSFTFSDNVTLASNAPPSTPSNSTVLHILRRYALFTKKSSDEARLFSCLARFQELVFVSFCDVVLRMGESKSRVHEAMKLYISDSTGQNIDKIIFGSRWVNRCIASLSDTAWGSRSPEIFILGGQTPNFYGRYAESGCKSEPYFLGRLEERVTNCSHPKQRTRIPISIPCIIKLLAGATVKLSVICDVLGYEYSSTKDLFERYYDGKFTGRDTRKRPHSEPYKTSKRFREEATAQVSQHTSIPQSQTADSSSLHNGVASFESQHQIEIPGSSNTRNHGAAHYRTDDNCPEPRLFDTPQAPPDFDVFQFDPPAQFNLPPEFDVFQFDSPPAQFNLPPEFDVFQFDSPPAQFGLPSMFGDVQSDPPPDQARAPEFNVF